MSEHVLPKVSTKKPKKRVYILVKDGFPPFKSQGFTIEGASRREVTRKVRDLFNPIKTSSVSNSPTSPRGETTSSTAVQV